MLEAIANRDVKMNDKYFESLQKYRRLLTLQGFSWVLTILIAVGTVVASEHLPKSSDSAILVYLPIFFAFCFIVYIANKVLKFRCPRCGKPFSTKYLLIHFKYATQCVHCGLSIYKTEDLEDE